MADVKHTPGLEPKFARVRCDQCEGSGFLRVSPDPELSDEVCSACRGRGWSSETLVYVEDDIRAFADATYSEAIDALRTLLDFWHGGHLQVRPEANGAWSAAVDDGELVITKFEGAARATEGGV